MYLCAQSVVAFIDQRLVYSSLPRVLVVEDEYLLL